MEGVSILLTIEVIVCDDWMINRSMKVEIYTKVYVIRFDCLYLMCESSWQLHISIKLLCYNIWTQCTVYILNNIWLTLNYSMTNRMLKLLILQIHKPTVDLDDWGYNMSNTNKISPVFLDR